jgi:hypothetical protein
MAHFSAQVCVMSFFPSSTPTDVHVSQHSFAIASFRKSADPPLDKLSCATGREDLDPKREGRQLRSMNTSLGVELNKALHPSIIILNHLKNVFLNCTPHSQQSRC